MKRAWCETAAAGTDQEIVDGRVAYTALREYEREIERGIMCCAVNSVCLKDLWSEREHLTRKVLLSLVTSFENMLSYAELSDQFKIIYVTVFLIS